MMFTIFPGVLAIWFGHALHQTRHLIAKCRAHLRQRRVSIFDDIVQDRRKNHIVRRVVFNQDAGDRQGMHDIRNARAFAKLPGMGARGEFDGVKNGRHASILLQSRAKQKNSLLAPERLLFRASGTRVRDLTRRYRLVSVKSRRQKKNPVN